MSFEIPGYRIEKEIGYGGMATVYLAEQVSLQRKVALKVMAPALAADRTFGERFLREGRMVGQLNHKNILSIYDIGQVDYSYYLASEYLPGGDLKRRIQKNGLSPTEACRIVRQLGAALAHAHGKGFVHRDIKPENVLFREDGSAVLTDFGIAKAIGSGTRMTQTGMSIGTPHYMSPEQARGQTVDQRSDLYSLGILFHEMLTGKVPYDAEETFAVGLKHINDPIPVLPDSLKQFQPIIDNLLAKEPGDRYADADLLVQAIDDIENGKRLYRPVHALKKASPKDEGATAGIKWALGGGVAALLLGIVAYFFLQGPVAGIGPGTGSSLGSTPVSASSQIPPKPLSSGSQAESMPVIGEAEETQNEAVMPLTAILSVQSRPEGAEVYLDGKKLGQAPLTMTDLPAGQHTLTLKKQYYLPKDLEVELVANQVVKRDVMLERGKGALTVLSDPPGATIWRGDTKADETTPATLHDLGAGVHAIRIHKDRYYDFEQNVEVLPGKTATLNADLSGGDLVLYEGVWMKPSEAEEKRKASLARLTIEPNPADVTVKILNIKPKYEPGMYLEPGKYHMEVSKNQHQTETRWLELQAGEHRIESVELVESVALRSNYTDPLTGMEFVWVPGGCFQMGDVFGDGDEDERPVHEVCVKGFYIGKYEVTIGEYFVLEKGKVVNTSDYRSRRYRKLIAHVNKIKLLDPVNYQRYPMNNLSWDEAQSFTAKINALADKQYRLPTEAEWEYAARSGGNKEKYSGGNKPTKVAWYSLNSNNSAHIVGQKQPNKLGVHDMSGNVAEWCSDKYLSSYYMKSPKDNPQGPASGPGYLIRGGTWSSNIAEIRTVSRNFSHNTDGRDRAGLRLVFDD